MRGVNVIKLYQFVKLLPGPSAKVIRFYIAARPAIDLSDS